MSQTRMMAAALVVLSATASAQPVEPPQTTLLHALFADHAVLQRDRPIDVWGVAQPSDDVTGGALRARDQVGIET
jgi:sialate O-acetylesterase